jgi:transketolase C-terminal domain/subunit
MVALRCSLIAVDAPDTVSVEKMVFAEEYKEKSCHLGIAERQELMNALFDGIPYDAVDQVESI